MRTFFFNIRTTRRIVFMSLVVCPSLVSKKGSHFVGNRARSYVLLPNSVVGGGLVVRASNWCVAVDMSEKRTFVFVG